METIAVFFGGKSNEREISIITGMYCVNLLRGERRVLPVYLDPAGGMLLGEEVRGVEEFRGGTPKSFKPVVPVRGGLAPANKPKKRIEVGCALNCCHGGAGEGGVLSALLEWYGIPSASPGMAESAVFLDKVLSKAALKGMDIPVLPAFALREEAFFAEGCAGGWRAEAAALGYPVVVKPSKLGSSVGISVAQTEEELEKALLRAFRLDESVLVEQYLKGKRDLNIAAYRRGEEIVLSPVEEVFSDSPILTFGEKYEGTGERRHELPARIPPETAASIADMLKRVYAQFGMRGIVRADFLLSASGEPYFNELNTVPGTLALYLFSDRLTEARDLLLRLLAEGKKRREEKATLQSGILSSAVFGGKNGLKRYI